MAWVEEEKEEKWERERGSDEGGGPGRASSGMMAESDRQSRMHSCSTEEEKERRLDCLIGFFFGIFFLTTQYNSTFVQFP